MSGIFGCGELFAGACDCQLNDHDLVEQQLSYPVEMHPSSTSADENPAARARALAGQLVASAGQAVQSLTVRKYTLPDKNVASQVLMYRQLLHTKCRPGLKLSREYQGTPAQKAVLHMPWWSKGIEETKKMEIAYDNLIRRLWLNGAIIPHTEKDRKRLIAEGCSNDSGATSSLGNLDTLLDDEGMPPVPHDYWVARVGFQQTDPVTDFRSGGILSLAMLVWIVESCPDVFGRFVRPSGDASVLPFGITSINITDMMAKFLMLSKATDRMDALLSQKPFWLMFADPNALLACQELSMDLLADVVVELREIRIAESKEEEDDGGEKVTVFDFAHILSVTEKRVEHDLLGAGPNTVVELRTIHKRLKLRYKHQLLQKISRLKEKKSTIDEGRERDVSGTNPNTASPAEAARMLQQQVVQQATGFGNAASSFAGSMFSKIKAPGFNSLQPTTRPSTESEAVVFENPSGGVADGKTGTVPPASEVEGEWAGAGVSRAAQQIGSFSIDDDDDDL